MNAKRVFDDVRGCFECAGRPAASLICPEHPPQVWRLPRFSPTPLLPVKRTLVTCFMC